MSNGKCGCNCICLLVLAIILGIVIATLFAFHLIPLISNIIPYLVAFILFDLGVLIWLLAKCAFTNLAAEGEAIGQLRSICRCLCKYAYCIFISAIVALISAVIALAIPLVPSFLFAIVLVFVLSTAVILKTFAFIAFVLCVIKSVCFRCSC